MRKSGLAVAVLFLMATFCSSSKADEVQYSLSGVFGSSVNDAPLSGPNGAYSMAFSLAQTPTPDYFDASTGNFAVYSVPVSYTFQCDGCAAPVQFTGFLDDVDFATTAIGGMLAVELVTDDGHDYYWEFWGDQLFSGTVDQPTLLQCGPYNLLDSGRFELDDAPFVQVGNATLTAQTTVSTPEPSSVTLLLVALASIGLIAWIKTQRA
jgi:hypothetical protein